MSAEEKAERRRETLKKYNANVRPKKIAWVKANKDKWRTYEQKRYAKSPFLRLISKSRVRSRAAGMENNLTVEWARARWTGRCELTGVEFKQTGGKQNSYSPSLDKIDPKKGYMQDNCRFILCGLNRLKGDEDDDVMRSIARHLVGH